jgi:hypothetical protein
MMRLSQHAVMPAITSTVPASIIESDANHSNGAVKRGHGSANGSNAAVNGSIDHVSTNVLRDVVDKLVVRVAGADDRESVAELAHRVGSPAPSGALMVGAVDGRVLAAVSISTRDTLSEPTPSGAAAVAVARYRVATLAKRNR